MKRFLTAVFLFFSVVAHAQFFADFENGNLDGWTQTPADAWSATSATGKLNGNFSLRHINSASSTTDYISAPIENFLLNEGTTVWRFRMKYNYNPTNTNKWAIILLADTPATAWKSGNFDGYAVGVNQAGGVVPTVDKILCLYGVQNGMFSEIIRTTINWNVDIGTSSTTTVVMEIRRNATGEWSLYVAKSNDFDEVQLYGTAIHTQFTAANYFGAINTYTSSSSGGQKLWLDDINITSSAFPAKILTVAQQGNKSILVSFNKPLQIAELQIPENYTLTFNTTAIHPLTIETISSKQVLLTFAELLPRGNVVVSVENLLDENGNVIIDHKPLFIGYNLYGDVVINEIMAAPVPAVGLPEVSYMELYNRLDMPVSLNGWKMEYITISSGAVTVGNIGAATIPANGYLILCASSAVDDMRYYGNAVNVSYLSSLTKSGKTLQLKTSEGQLLSRVTYSDKWITDDAKRNGGWSLEKIDAANLSESAANWAASEDANGGTPGQQNSVQHPNPDIETPFVTELTILDNQTLLLTFNELFDTIRAKNHSCYFVSNGIGNPQQILLNSANPQQLTLQFAKTFAEGIVYTLTVETPFSDLAGNAPDGTYSFGNLFSPGNRDIVINEVLFNPNTNGVDFVEIYNRSDKIFNLQQVKLANRDKNNEVASVHTVSQQHFLLPGDYAVFTTNVEVVQQFYSVPFPEKTVTLATLPTYPNDNGCVVLLSDKDIMVDEFLYSEKMHSGFINNPKGISLERVNPDRLSNERANWQSAAQDAGFATPTYRNSQYQLREEKTESEFSLPYEVFSPDGDGYNDVLYIDYSVATSGYVATITIYDAQGRLVKTVEKNTLLGASGRFAWDGTRYDSHKASVGIYIIFIEYFDLNGNVKRFKKTCAVAMR
jgi:hypothetical protein